MGKRIKFEIGELVQMRSGSPRMVVIEHPPYSTEGEHRVQWYENGEVHDAVVFPVTLKPARALAPKE